MAVFLQFLSIFMLAALPSTSNYKLNSFGFGSGGTANSGTANYSLEGISGEISGSTGSTANYKLKPGFIETQQANVSTFTTFDNPTNYYNKLRFIIDQQGNPSDAKYALSISTDNFASDIRFVKSDLTVGNTLALTDYQTYAVWGGATGSNIIGLLPNTTYYLRVKATQGKFTESGYGPISTAATVGPRITFGITTDSQSSPPFSIAFGTILPGVVATSSDHINNSFDTNAEAGGNIYIYSKNAGLLSTSASYTIASASGDLSALSEGFGSISTNASQVSGGPLTAQSPYNGASNNVGLVDTQIRKLYATAGPVTTGTTSILLKAKPSNITPAATDYVEIITMIAAASF